MKDEGLVLDFEKRSIKGYLLKPGKPLKERLKEQFDQLRELLS